MPRALLRQAPDPSAIHAPGMSSARDSFVTCIFSLLLHFPLMSSDEKPHLGVQTTGRNCMEEGSLLGETGCTMVLEQIVVLVLFL